MSKAIPSKSQSDAIVVIGKLGRPYGVRGWLALQSFTEPRENILAYQPWRIQTGQNSDWVNVGDFLAKPHKDAFSPKSTASKTEMRRQGSPVP